MSEAPPNTHKEGRTGLRDTAKWMMSGVFGVIALLASSTTIPQFATLDPGSRAFAIAAGTLGAAALLCWIPFWLAVRVLRSELVQLGDFAEPPRNWEFRVARDKVNKRIGSTLAGTGSVEAFFAAYDTLKKSARAVPGAEADAKVAVLKRKFAMCRETCISQLVSDRFGRLAASIGICGTIIIILFATSVYTMNSAQQTVVTAGKIGTEAITADLDKTLQALRVDPACFGQTAQLLTFGPAEDGQLTKVLVPRPGAAATCKPKLVTYLNDRPVMVE